jgi:hypothetical protein
MVFPLGSGRPLPWPWSPQPRTAEAEPRADADADADADVGQAQLPLQSSPVQRRPADQRRPDPRAAFVREQLERGLPLPGGGAPPLPGGVVNLGQLGQLPDQSQPVGAGGKGQPGPARGQGGKGGVFDAPGRDLAQLVLRQVKPPAVGNAYAQQKAEVRADLERLGLLGPGTGRVHIDDANLEHGGAVTRAAVGPTSLAQGADVSLNTSGVPAEFAAGRRTPEQAARLSDLGDRADEARQGRLTTDGMAQLVADELEQTLLDHGDAVAYVRGKLPDDGKDTFMNMSWGQSPERLLGRSVGQLMMAPEGSPAYEEVTRILGHAPTRTPQPDGSTRLETAEFKAVRAALEPKLDAILASPEHQARMAAGRDAAAREVAAGRQQGLLVFAAAGNEHGAAERSGRPELAVSTLSGVPGVILVGATDPGGPGAADDVVAPFSKRGRGDGERGGGGLAGGGRATGSQRPRRAGGPGGDQLRQPGGPGGGLPR